MITQESIIRIFEKVLNAAEHYAPHLFGALVLLGIGWIVIGWVTSFTSKLLKRMKVDRSLSGFLESFVTVGLRAVLLISVAGMLGFETTSLIAMLSAMAFAVGMALQGSLSNFAGGVLLLVFKPFRAGDTIEAQGHKGKVRSIQIFQTVLRTPDNKQIIIPNGDLSNGSIINYSATGKRRIDIVFSVGYNDDTEKAKGIIANIISKNERVLKDKKIKVFIGNLGDSAVDIYCRAWVNSVDYFGVKYDTIDAVKHAFDKAHISIPYPQMDVHVSKTK